MAQFGMLGADTDTAPIPPVGVLAPQYVAPSPQYVPPVQAPKRVVNGSAQKQAAVDSFPSFAEFKSALDEDGSWPADPAKAQQLTDLYHQKVTMRSTQFKTASPERKAMMTAHMQGTPQPAGPDYAAQDDQGWGNDLKTAVNNSLVGNIAKTWNGGQPLFQANAPEGAYHQTIAGGLGLAANLAAPVAIAGAATAAGAGILPAAGATALGWGVNGLISQHYEDAARQMEEDPNAPLDWGRNIRKSVLQAGIDAGTGGITHGLPLGAQSLAMAGGGMVNSAAQGDGFDLKSGAQNFGINLGLGLIHAKMGRTAPKPGEPAVPDPNHPDFADIQSPADQIQGRIAWLSQHLTDPAKGPAALAEIKQLQGQLRSIGNRTAGHGTTIDDMNPAASVKPLPAPGQPGHVVIGGRKPMLSDFPTVEDYYRSQGSPVMQDLDASGRPVTVGGSGDQSVARASEPQAPGGLYRGPVKESGVPVSVGGSDPNGNRIGAGAADVGAPVTLGGSARLTRRQQADIIARRQAAQAEQNQGATPSASVEANAPQSAPIALNPRPAIVAPGETAAASFDRPQLEAMAERARREANRRGPAEYTRVDEGNPAASVDPDAYEAAQDHAAATEILRQRLHDAEIRKEQARAAMIEAHQEGIDSRNGDRKSIGDWSSDTLTRTGDKLLHEKLGEMAPTDENQHFASTAREFMDARRELDYLQSPSAYDDALREHQDSGIPAWDAPAHTEPGGYFSEEAALHRLADGGPGVGPAKTAPRYFDKEAARQRIKDRGFRLNSGVDPEHLTDYAIIGAHRIRAGLSDFGGWARAMVGDFGKGIAPHLRTLFVRSSAMVDANGRVKPDAEAMRQATYRATAERASISADTLRRLEWKSSRNGNDVYSVNGHEWEHTGMDGSGRAVMTKIPTAAISAGDRVKLLSTAQDHTGNGPLPVGGEGVKGDPNFKLKNLDSGDGVKRVIATTAKTESARIEAERRGTVSKSDTVGAAEAGIKSGKYSDDWLVNHPRKTAFNDEEMTAAKALVERQSAVVHSMSKELAPKIDTGTITDVEMAKFAGEVEKQTALHAKFSGGVAEVARALNAAKFAASLTNLNPRLIRDIVSSKQKGAIGWDAAIKPTPEQLRIQRVIDDMGGINNLKRIIKQTAGADPTTVSKQLQKMTDPTLIEKGLYVYKAGMVSSLRTIGKIGVGQRGYQVMTAIDNQFGALSDLALSALPIASGERSVGGLSATDIGRALKISNTKGMRDGWQILKGEKIDNDSNIDSNHKEMRAENWAGNKILQAANLVFRSHSAAYRPVYEYGLQTALGELATIRAANEVKAGLYDKSEMAKRKDFWYQNPDEAMSAAAVQAGTEAIMTNNNVISSKIGAARRGHDASSQLWGAAQDLVMPFTKVPTNMAIAIADHSGVGQVVRIARTMIHRADEGRMWAALNPAEQRGVSMALGKGMTGAGLMLLGGLLAKNGYMTGVRPTDPGTRNRDEVQGAMPGSIKLGGNWVNVAGYQPVANMMIMGATMQLNKGANPAVVYGQNMAEMPMLQGMDAINSALHDPEKKGERFIGNLGKAAVPTLLGDAAASTDDVQRDINGGTMGEQFMHGAMSKVPGLRQMLPPKLDAFGQPLPQDRSQVINPSNSRTDLAQKDPLIGEISRLQMDIPKAMSTVQITNPDGNQERVHLTTEEHNDLLRRIGVNVDKYVRPLVASPKWAGMTDDQKREQLKDEIHYANEDARRDFSDELAGRRYPAK